MLAQKHPSHKLSDYVLDLLSPAERQRVENHLARCTDCRRALNEERGLLRDVRQTIQIASGPSPARLSQLMPAPPTAARRHHFVTLLRPALAFSVVVALFVLSLQIYMPSTNGAALPPTATSLAATVTSTPTSTAEAGAEVGTALQDAGFSATQSPANRTPLAALYNSAHN